MSSTLTRTNSKNTKYKDYVSFLHSYKSGAKDDQSSDGGNFSLNNSSNNSSSSVFSDHSDVHPNMRNQLHETLRNIKNFKNGEVNHNFNKPLNSKVKTEMVIQINNPPEQLRTHSFEVKNINSHNEEPVLTVSHAAKIFEKNEQSNGNTHHVVSKKNSIGEMTKRFENSSNSQNNGPQPMNKAPVQKKNSISEVSKIFQNENKSEENGTVKKFNNFNRTPKAFTPSNPIEPKRNLVKPPITSPKPEVDPPLFFRTNLTVHHKLPTSSTNSTVSSLSSLSTSPSPPHSLSPTPPMMCSPPLRVSSPPPLIVTSATPEPNIPPPPPFEDLNQKTVRINGSVAPPPPPPLENFTKKTEKNSNGNVPLPPPFPTGNIHQKPSSTHPKKVPVASNQPSDLVDGRNGALNKNDPRLKRAVYGALRNMYGAYHDQANDYIATLPKNRVKKNNKLDGIIESIAQTRLPDLTRYFGPSTSLLTSRRRYSDFRLDTDTLDSNMEPPACVQNAMMKQDKKPFTYTPGGIDLSEVRSPRMQRRIERNANLAGAGDSPKPNPYPQNAGPLPPSALAAMRPQTQVQVYPQPPPPPPMKSIPPPPPPPACPLPTQKITTSDNQVLERPDMTKIIPENPMTLLRKTGGPAPRPTSMVDAVYQAPSSPSQKFQPPVIDRQVTTTSPPIQQYQQPYQSPPSAQRQLETRSPEWQPQQQSLPHAQQLQQQYQAPPPPQRDLGVQSPRWPQNSPAQQSPPPVQPQQSRPSSQTFDPPKSSYQPPVIQRPPTKVNANVGSLYIPPINQQNTQQPQRVVSPPTPPQREPQVQSPGTPTLREAPRPWQGKSGQQQELPPWARKEDNVENNQLPSQITTQNANSQQRWQQQPPLNAQNQQQQRAKSPQPAPQQYSPKSPPTHQQQGHQGNQGHSGGFPVHIEIRAVPYPNQPQESEDRKPNAVYITQPLILQHPGGPGGIKVVNPPTTQQAQPRSPQPAQNQPRQNNVYQQKEVTRTTTTTKQDSSSTRIIPIQMEPTPPSTPTDRSLNHQLSWGQNPSQSNKFKVIQKITQTDEDVNDDTPITQHSARFTQEMPEQFKGMKVSNGDRFKQGIKRFDEENPRYRGGHIPSRIFKMLDDSVPQQYQGNGSNNVHRSTQNNEGTGQPQKYVHPSEQTVPEPKKYMGGNIPSRSFKILQAMTAPESCANVNNNEDLPHNYIPCHPYPYPPYYPPPYWHEYYTNFYPYEQSESLKVGENKIKSGRTTPQHTARTTPLLSERLTPQSSGKTTPSFERSTTPLPILPPPMYPSPFWGYPPSSYQDSLPKTDSDLEIKTCSSTDSVPQQNMYPPNYPIYHPPYFDPYYYYYYHGYPPVPSPYHFFSSASDSENIQSGYESSEELASYSKKVLPTRRNSIDNSVQNIKQQFELRSQSAIPRVAETPANLDRPFFLNKTNEAIKTDALEEKDYESKSVQDLRQQFESNGQFSITRDPIPPRTSPVQNQHAFKFFGALEIETTDALQEKLYKTMVNDKEELGKTNELSRLRSIKSVNNISTFKPNDFSFETDSSDDKESSEDEEDSEHLLTLEIQEEEIIPHQLSIIFEESERNDSRALRPCSAMTDASTINENSDDDSFSEAFTISHNLTVKVTQESNSSHTTTLNVGNNFVQAFREENETSATFTLSPSRSPGKLSPCKIEECFVKTRKQSSQVSEENGKLVVHEQTCCEESYNISGAQNDTKRQQNESSVEIEEVTENSNICTDIIDTNITDVVYRKKRDRQIVDSPKQNSDNDSDKDFWQILGKDKESPISSRTNSAFYGYDDSPKTTRTNSVIYADDPEDIKTNSTIYDELKKTDSPPRMSESGRLMDVDNFVAKLEELKRNSGLWDNDDIDFTKDPNCRKFQKKDFCYNKIKESKENSDLWTINKNESEDVNPKDERKINHIYRIAQETSTDNNYEELSDEIEKASENSDESIDFWSQIKTNEEDFQPKIKNFYDTEYEKNETELNPNINLKPSENTNIITKNSSSASSRHSSFSKRSFSSTENIDEIPQSDQVKEFNSQRATVFEKLDVSAHKEELNTQKESDYVELDTSDSETSSPSDKEYLDEETQNQNVTKITKDMSDPPEPQTIKERIEALKNSTMHKRHSQEITEDIQVCVKRKVTALEVINGTNNTSKTTSTKSSVKSFEEFSDEEVDSGVNSDLSRHISDNEEFPELKKLTRYERAATHSRLFKLLQDECDEDEECKSQTDCKNEVVADKFSKLSIRNRGETRLTPSRSKLNLHLNKGVEDKEMAQHPVNEKLADELVQSILTRRKGQIFRSMPKEKIYAAAIKILQEDAESTGTPSEEFSSLLSPLRGDTESSTPAQTPQEFYNEYKQYYDSWNTNDDCDLIPSKAFKLLQDHISASKLGTIEGFLAKCPRVLSNKNIPDELTKLFEGNDCSFQTLSLDSQTTNEVTNTS